MNEMIQELKGYKKVKAELTIRQERIRIWTDVIENNNTDKILEIFSDTPEDTFGMPKAKYRKTSPVEVELFKKEDSISTIKKIINKERDIVVSMEYRISRIEIGLNALTEEERFIINCKYIENMRWEHIEDAYNSKFRKKRNNGVTDKILQNKTIKIKRKLYELLYKI